MSFPNRLLTQPTWRILGLSAATTFASLGIWAIATPLSPADSLGVTPTTADGRAMVSKTMIFIAARDLSVASALFWFDYLGSQKAMGVLLSCCSIVYVLDIWVAAQGPRGWDAGIWGLTSGGIAATFVGWGLVQSPT